MNKLLIVIVYVLQLFKIWNFSQRFRDRYLALSLLRIYKKIDEKLLIFAKKFSLVTNSD